MNKMLLLLLFLAIQLTAVADDEKTVGDRIAAILSAAKNERDDALLKADRDYRVAFAKTLPFADRIEVFLLDFSYGADAAYKSQEGDAVFPIRPDKRETKILKSARVPAQDIPKWCAAVTQTITSDKTEGIAGCHYPIHGLRMFAGEELLFETSFCWACNNYYFSYEWQSGWVGLTKDAKDLKILFEEFMPIPEVEKLRFSRIEGKP